MASYFKPLAPFAEEMTTQEGSDTTRMLTVFAGSNMYGRACENRFLHGIGSTLCIDAERIRNFDEYTWIVNDRLIRLVCSRDVRDHAREYLARTFIELYADIVCYSLEDNTIEVLKRK